MAYDSLHSTVLGRVMEGQKCMSFNMVSMMLTVIHSPGALRNNQVPRDPHFEDELRTSGYAIM